MEKKKDEIEDVFKESFNDFEPEVEPKVWKNVKTAVKWGSAGLLLKYAINKVGTNTLMVIATAAITAVSTVWVMENKNKSSEIADGQEEHIDVVKTTTPVETKEEIVSNEIKQSELSGKAAKGQNLNNNERENSDTEPRSFKNTTITEVTDANKVKTVINNLSKQSIAIISATPISGSAPLIVNLSNAGNGVKNQWSFSDGQASTEEANPARAFLAGKHTVILKSISADGKIAIDSVRITVTDVSSLKPIQTNSFSPNGDGVADVFSFQSKNMVSMQAEIYDKNSNLIYKWKGTDGHWDGKTLKGGLAPPGMYFYIITAEGIDGKKYEQKAVVQLLP